MKCPKCEAEGEKSKLFVGAGYTTLAAVQTFYDEDGTYHSHDLNTCRTAYECSRGHSFTLSEVKSCPQEGCEWNDKFAWRHIE